MDAPDLVPQAGHQFTDKTERQFWKQIATNYFVNSILCKTICWFLRSPKNVSFFKIPKMKETRIFSLQTKIMLRAFLFARRRHVSRRKSGKPLPKPH